MNTEQTLSIMKKYRVSNECTLFNIEGIALWSGNKYYLASDRYQMVLIPENEENKLSLTAFNQDINTIIPAYNKNVEVDINRLKSVYESVELIDSELEVECPCCDGIGEILLREKYIVCPLCKRSRRIGTGEFEKIKNPDVFLEFGDSLIDNAHIKTLLEVILETNCKSLKIRYASPTGLLAFELDGSIVVATMSGTLAQKTKIIKVV